MKRILTLLILLIPALCFSQKYSDNILYGKKENRIIAFVALGVPNDTAALATYPDSIKRKPHIAVKSNVLYLWDTTLYIWSAFAGGSGWSSVDGGFGLIAVNDSTLRADTLSIVQWARLYKVADSLAALVINQKFGHPGGDYSAGENRAFNGHGTYNFRLDSINTNVQSFSGYGGGEFVVWDYDRGDRLNITPWYTWIRSPNDLSRIDLYDDTVRINLNTTSSKLIITNIPYNSDPDLISIVYDSTDGRLYRQIISGSGSTPTLQQVFNTEVGGSVLTKIDTIDVGSNYLRINGSGSSYSLLATNTSSGAALNAINFGSGYALVGNAAGTGIGLRGTSVTSLGAEIMTQASNGSNIVPVASYSAQAASVVGANGIGGQINYNIESTTTQPAEAAKFQYYYTDATHATRTVRLNWLAYNNGAEETFLQMQADGTFIVNNGADTLAKLSDVLAAGGGGISAADLPLRITGSTVSADTSVAYNPSLTTNLRTQKIVDSLSAAGWSNQSIYSESRYQHWLEMGFGGGSVYGGLYWAGNGTGAGVSAIVTTSIPDGWLFGHHSVTGTTTTGRAYHFALANSSYAAISISSSKRYNFGSKIRLEDLSDGTETYHVFTGFGDDANDYSTIVDGIGFRYAHGDSSGVWIACTKSNSTITEDATDITVAADTDYELEVSVYNGNAYFYINKVLKATITTNIPTGSTRFTSVVHFISKDAGTTSRSMYTEWLAYGKQSN